MKNEVFQLHQKEKQRFRRIVTRKGCDVLRSRFAVVVMVLGGVLFYSFLLYGLAQIPLLGMTFTHYLDVFATLALVPSVVFGGACVYYHLYDRLAFFHIFGTKCIVGFAVSFFSLYGWDALSNGLHFHMATTVVFSGILTCLFIDDPNSMRSINRTKNKLKENRKEED